MNIYKVSNEIVIGYDTYDSFICVAKTKDEARVMHPSSFVTHYHDGHFYGTYSSGGEYLNEGRNWPPFSRIDELKITLIGVASKNQKKGIVLASFNAG